MLRMPGSLLEKTDDRARPETAPLRSDKAKPKEMLCVVVATYDTWHGTSQAVIQATRNAREAVSTAREAEKLGYEFNGSDTGVGVYYLEMSRQYEKKEFSFSNPDAIPVNYPVILWRYKIAGQWREKWFSETMKFILGLS